MEICITNCNSVDDAKIKVQENKLNIKYAVNGTGKSTIAKAIELHLEGKGNLKRLTPFKYLGKDQKDYAPPMVVGLETIKTVCIFNETYIGQFAFREDELVKNSFEIFIKNEDYDKRMAEIDKAMLEIKQTFTKNDNLQRIIQDLVELSDCFGNSREGYHASGVIGKGIAKGNKIENIPSGLEAYSDYLKSGVNVKWIKWQIDGTSYVDLSTSCPFCTSSTEGKKDKIKSVAKEYDAKSIEHLNRLLLVLDRLGKYFTKESLEKFTAITKNKSEISPEGKAYLKAIRGQIDALKEKLISLQELTFFSFKDVKKAIELISALKIEIDLLPDLKSQETLEIVKSVNASLEAVATKAGVLEAEVGKQRTAIQRAIREHKDEINGFLKYAGYRYEVDIVLEDDMYKMKLRHQDMSTSVAGGAERLSFGEKNAFAIVLFMYECISKNPDLIILDDPISSFDRNKKFAIMNTLFAQKRSLKGKTVLLMTHDLEPVIDTIYSLRRQFGETTVASFLESKTGQIREVPISKEDILSFVAVCDSVVSSKEEEVVKLIYLRRYHEIMKDKGYTYQLISNLLHKRDVPVYQGADRNMTVQEIADAEAEIAKSIPGFSYLKNLKTLKDDSLMKLAFKNTQHNYSKMQIFRVIKGNLIDENDILAKYVNESFHVENDYIMQLNPSKYEMVPHYIIDECAKILSNV